MSMMMLCPDSSDSLLEISSALGGFVNKYDLSPDRNIVVYCFDYTVAEWRTLPAAWHRPLFGDIVLNMPKILKSLHEKDKFGHFTGSILSQGEDNYHASPTLISETAQSLRTLTRPHPNYDYPTYVADGVFNDARVADTHPKIATPLAVATYKHRTIIKTPSDSLRATLLAVILHETGHSVFSRYITEEWYSQLPPYRRSIMTMFEELRAERQQVKRVGGGTALIRRAADIVVDPNQVAEDITKARDKSGKINIANLALNSTLCLGRSGYGVFLDHELTNLRTLIVNTVGEDRYGEMTRIWDDFSGIREIDPDAMRKSVDEWADLFPSAKDGSGVSSSISIVIKLPRPETPPEPEEAESEEDSEESVGTEGENEDSSEIAFTYDDPEESDEQTDAPDALFIDMSGEPSDPPTEDAGGSESDSQEGDDEELEEEEELDLPGIADEFAESVKEPAQSASEFPADTNNEYGPSHRMPTYKAISFAESATRNSANRINEVMPSAADQRSSQQLAQELLKMNVSALGKFKVNSAAPPGRLRSRAAVQQAADRAAGRISTAQPWRGTRRTIDRNPPLTVGIMTDTSSSQEWATQFSSRVAWIIAHAISKINGRSAAVTFGSEVLITMRPGERSSKRKVVAARDHTELFDIGVGTLDTMLKLTTGTGVRILFVVTDGQLVEGEGLEMGKAAEWVRILVRSGCLVIYIVPEGTSGTWVYKHRCVPSLAIPIEVDTDVVRLNPTPLIGKIAQVLKRELSARSVG